jgi:TonB family protein
MNFVASPRFLSVLMACFLSLVSYGGEKKVQMTFDLVALDAYTNKKTEGVTIGIYTLQGELILEGQTDHRGRFSPSLELEPKEHEVRVSDEQNRFVSYSYSFYPSKKWSNHSVEIILYPSEHVLNQWIAREDSIYGTTKTGSLDPALNTDSLIYGCTMEELGEASFPDGLEAMQKFLMETIRYPQVSIEAGEQGRVYLKFVIEQDGEITHVEVERGVSPILDGEAIRVVRNMPPWTPALCNETKIRALARLPLSFTLN